MNLTFNLRWCATLCVLGFPLAQAQNSSLTVLTVGLLAPLSGPHRAVGADMIGGVKLCLKETQPELTRLGLSLKLQSYDDGSDNSVAGVRASQMLKTPGLVVALGSYSSSVTLTAGSLFAPAKLALIAPSSTGVNVDSVGLGTSNIVRLVPRADALGGAYVSFLREQLGVKSVHLVQDSSEDAAPLIGKVSDELRRQGLRLAGFNRVQGSADYALVVAALQKTQPDAVFYAGSSGLAAGIVRAMRSAKLSAVFIGGDSLTEPNFKVAAGPASSGVYLGTVSVPLALSKATKALAAAYLVQFKTEASGYSVLGYDACRVAVDALKRVAGKSGGQQPTRAQVLVAVRSGALEKLLSGEVRFDARGERVQSSFFINQYGSDAVLRLVKVVAVGAK